jgi:hypothetical protein
MAFEFLLEPVAHSGIGDFPEFLTLGFILDFCGHPGADIQDGLDVARAPDAVMGDWFSCSFLDTSNQEGARPVMDSGFRGEFWKNSGPRGYELPKFMLFSPKTRGRIL